MRILFEKLLCKHKWKVLKEIDYMDSHDNTGIPAYKKILYCCENCGKLKKIKF